MQFLVTNSDTKSVQLINLDQIVSVDFADAKATIQMVRGDQHVLSGEQAQAFRGFLSQRSVFPSGATVENQGFTRV